MSVTFIEKTKTVPCKFCSKPTPMTGTQQCDRCWELSTRITFDTDLAESILRKVRLLQLDREFERYRSSQGLPEKPAVVLRDQAPVAAQRHWIKSWLALKYYYEHPAVRPYE